MASVLNAEALTVTQACGWWSNTPAYDPGTGTEFERKTAKAEPEKKRIKLQKSQVIRVNFIVLPSLRKEDCNGQTSSLYSITEWN